MPVHIYECFSCGVREDYLVQPRDPTPSCASCGEDSLIRTMEGQTFSAHVKNSVSYKSNKGAILKEIGTAIGIYQNGISLGRVYKEVRKPSESNN